jgi:hypothetical protein
MEWMDLAQDREQWRAYGNETLLSIKFHETLEKLSYRAS